ncbi:hypothetical protein FIBSPDRAFT_938452 [Athelia psychrophila]|uniref:DUF6533 domain-containing protein n=1 Tax=Athelia psychrophila TaxID=1759441 RepID=A0A165YFC3_9AGAM|nr:hypothetical protein FIBSPDRAFT_938452 [Fibularhizoctonia sp. CBS 109695]
MSVLEQIEAGVSLSQLTAALTTVIAWDILICLEEEVDLAVRCGFNPSSIVYFTSRTGVLLWGILLLMLETVPFSNCQVIWNITAIITVIAGGATALLFVIRVSAVYEQSNAVKLFFAIFWLATPVSSILVAIYGRSSHAGSATCTISNTQFFTYLCLWIEAAFNTSIFIAITWRIISYSTACKAPLWQSFRGAGLPRICRELLQGGQLFYFVTVGITLTGACATFMPVNQVLRIRLTEPAFAFQSIMACRAHRRIVLRTSRFKANPDSPHSIAMTTVLPYFPNPEVPSNMGLEQEHETQVVPQVA